VILDKDPAIPGHLIFDLLFQNKSSPVATITGESAIDEAVEFWQREEEDFVAKMQVSNSMREAEEEIVLPEDIMPSFDQMLQQEADLVKTNQGESKKQKVWGPIQPVRQSSRIDRSKHIMDKAMELKEKKNAMLSSKKLSGIMHSNPFHVLQSSEFIDMSSKLGVVITVDDDDVPFVDVSSQIVDSPVSVVERDSL
jgi:hypothetical protein